MKKRVTLRAALVGLCLGALAGGPGAVPASATSSEISGSQRIDDVVQWNTGRTTNRQPTAATFTLGGFNVGTGGELILGYRQRGSQIARAVTGQRPVAGIFRLPDDRTELPQGTFYINSALTGACGGDGCGVVTWTATLNWNL